MAVIAGSLTRSIGSKVDQPSLIVAQPTGKIVHVSQEGARFLGRNEDDLLGRDIRSVLPVAVPPQQPRKPGIHSPLDRQGSWTDRAVVPGIAGGEPVQLRWRSVPLGWVNYWIVNVEETRTAQEDPLLEGFPEIGHDAVKPGFRLLRHPRVGDNWRLMSFHRPVGGRGGDVLFIEDLGPNHLLYFLGDVAGHHRGAVLVRLMLMTYLRVYREEFNAERPGRFPGNLLDSMNRALSQDEYNDCLLTAIALVLEKRGDRAYFASAGHHPMFLVRSGRGRHVFTTPDIPLGIRPRQRYRTVQIDCAPGDRLLCYTDGLITAGPSMDFRAGLKALLETLEECRDASQEALAGRIRRLWNDGGRLPNAFEDDVTFSVIAQTPSRVSRRQNLNPLN